MKTFSVAFIGVSTTRLERIHPVNCAVRCICTWDCIAVTYLRGEHVCCTAVGQMTEGHSALFSNGSQYFIVANIQQNATLTHPQSSLT